MRQFFHGWKRNAGAATLLLACLAMGAMLRGYSIVDEFYFGSGQGLSLTYVGSAYYGVSWRRICTNGKIGWKPGRISRTLIQEELKDPSDVFPQAEWVVWKRQYWGFVFAERWDGENSLTLESVVIPYWILIWPLILLSVYLLFDSKYSVRDARPEDRSEQDGPTLSE